MWNNTIPGIGETVYNYAMWFLIYSVMGWIVESIYMSCCNRKITNRGFTHGPMCPIYGFGGTLIHIAVRRLEGQYILMYVAGAVIATLFEFLTARVMIKVFGYVWWDYNNKPFNFRGIICLESTLAWGFYTVLEALVLYNVAFFAIGMIPVVVGKIIVVFAAVAYLMDFLYCAVKAKKGELKADENNLMQYS